MTLEEMNQLELSLLFVLDFDLSIDKDDFGLSLSLSHEWASEGTYLSRCSLLTAYPLILDFSLGVAATSCHDP